MGIEATGISETRERFEGIAARLRDLSPVMQVIAEDTRTLIDDSFQSSSSPDGVAWQPFSEATFQISPRREGGRLLVDTGRLRNSITTQSGRTGFSFGTNVRYAGPQQFGASTSVFGRKRTQLPARPFLPITGGAGRYQLMGGGRAGLHWAEMRAAINHYVRTGEIL